MYVFVFHILYVFIFVFVCALARPTKDHLEVYAQSALGCFYYARLHFKAVLIYNTK